MTGREKDSVYYRGVSIEDVVESIAAADLFLRESFSDYPYIQDLLDGWMYREPYSMLFNATDPETIENALRDSYTTGLLRFFQDIFEFHALTDTEGADNGLGMYRNLTRWGAFMDSQKFDAGYQARAERDTKLTLDYFDIIKSSIANTPIGEQATSIARLTGYLRAEFENAAHEAADVHLVQNNLNGKVSGFLHMADSSIARDYYEELSRDEQIFVRKALHVATGFDVKRHLVRQLSPFQKYGIVIPVAYQGRQSIEEMCRLGKFTIENDVKGIDPLRRDWIKINGKQDITLDGSQMGLAFTTTRDIAQLVANRLPKRKIIDDMGQRIMPEGHDPRPGF